MEEEEDDIHCDIDGLREGIIPRENLKAAVEPKVGNKNNRTPDLAKKLKTP